LPVSTVIHSHLCAGKPPQLVTSKAICPQGSAHWSKMMPLQSLPHHCKWWNIYLELSQTQ